MISSCYCHCYRLTGVFRHLYPKEGFAKFAAVHMQMIGRGPFPIMLLKDVTPQDPRPYLMAPNFSRISFPIYADHQCKPPTPQVGSPTLFKGSRRLPGFHPTIPTGDTTEASQPLSHNHPHLRQYYHQSISYNHPHRQHYWHFC